MPILTKLTLQADVATHGFFGKSNVTSTFMNQSLPAPILNISAFYIEDTRLFGYNWTDSTTGEQPFRNKSKMTWAWSNETYDSAYVATHGSCQTLEVCHDDSPFTMVLSMIQDYQWGFSFFQLYLMILLLLLWTVGTLLMCGRTQMIMQKRGREDIAGEYKAILEVAAAIHKQTQIFPDDLSTVTERHLQTKIKKELGGGEIAYESPTIVVAESRNELKFWKAWAIRERWWITAFVSSIIMVAALPYAWVESVYFLPGLSAALFLAIYVGTVTKSRVLILLVLFIILGLLPLFVVKLVQRYAYY